jgi:hypothetical protein
MKRPVLGIILAMSSELMLPVPSATAGSNENVVWFNTQTKLEPPMPLELGVNKMVIGLLICFVTATLAHPSWGYKLPRMNWRYRTPAMPI